MNGFTSSANGNWTYSYDDFNRLTGSSKNSGQQTYNYVYDRFGNRWQQNAPLGGNQFQGTFMAGNNRMDGYSYDAAGNMTTDNQGHTYIYDAENRIVSMSGGAVTYTYDADGQRVEKNVSGVKTDYVYDPSGNAIAEVNASGAAMREELFAGSHHVGTYVNNTTYFSHADWLGTERVRSDMTGAACETISSLPFGDGESTGGSCGDPSTRHFTGKERDAESGLDYFGARYYSNGMGRFITPDWSATPIPVPYAHLDDPQTLNQYVYVRDRPLTLSDRDGHGFWRKLWNCFSYGSCHETNEIIDNERTYLRDRGVAIRDPKTGKIIKYSDATNAQIDDAFRSLRNMEIFNQIRDALGIPPTVPPMLGANGTQVTSKTLWQEDKARIDVENPNPGQRPGQIHYQDETGKYIYDVGTGRFQGLSQTQNDNLLSKPEVQTAIQKGLRYLGVGQ